MKTKIICITTFCMALLWSCKSNESYLPLDVLNSCTLTQDQFNTWFASGTASENGSVNPANSVDFVHNNNCDFYKWSEQMFLWITSPEAKNKTVFESPMFYTVAPVDGLGNRILIPHNPGKLMRVESNLRKKPVDSEEGQATDDVLIAKDGSLIYYITMVNDVYAEYLKAVKSQKMGGKLFPTTAADRDSIFNYAKSNGVILKNPNTLAIELKTSWIDASTIKDLSGYITIDAIIPTYTKTAAVWTPKGEKKAKLALVGVHIVGSAAGHPEMVWATFEHQKNTPNVAYDYLDSNNKVKTIAADTGNDWLLNANSANTVYNLSHNLIDSVTKKNIVANAKNKILNISASNTKRTKPWGAANDAIPNAEDPSTAASNSEVISINNSIRTMLVGNDIRKNYLFIGATWTSNGTAPNSYSYSPQNTEAGVAIGTSQLANSTMETYAQNGEQYSKTFGTCFACHSLNKANQPTLDPNYISHVFKRLQGGLPVIVTKK
jgi:hypothetical protein